MKEETKIRMEFLTSKGFTEEQARAIICYIEIFIK